MFCVALRTYCNYFPISINLLSFALEIERVYWTVRTESADVIPVNSVNMKSFNQLSRSPFIILYFILKIQFYILFLKLAAFPSHSLFFSMCQVEGSKLMTMCFASFINNCVLFASPKESRDVNRNFSKNI